MSSIFTNEFYDHLYELESKSTANESWVSCTSENDPNLQWCRNFIEEKLSVREEKWFRNKLNECFENGIVGRNGIARAMGISVQSYKDFLEKYDLVQEEQYLLHLWHGLVFQHSKNGSIIFYRNKKIAAKTLKIKVVRSIDSVIGAVNGRRIRGYYVYKTSQWKQKHPEFDLAREDVISNEIIRIA